MPPLLSLSRPFSSSTSNTPLSSPSPLSSPVPSTAATPAPNPSTTSALIQLVKRPTSGRGNKRAVSGPAAAVPTVSSNTMGTGLGEAKISPLLPTSYIEQVSLQLSDCVNKVFSAPSSLSSKTPSLMPGAGMGERCRAVGEKIESVLMENLKDIFIFRSILRSGVLRNLSLLHDRLSSILGPILTADPDGLANVLISHSCGPAISHNTKDPFAPANLTLQQRLSLEILSSGTYLHNSLERVERALIKQLGTGSGKEPSLVLLHNWESKFEDLAMRVMDPMIDKIRKTVAELAFKGCSHTLPGTPPANTASHSLKPKTLSPSPSLSPSASSFPSFPHGTPPHLVKLGKLLGGVKHLLLEKVGVEIREHEEQEESEGEKKVRKWLVGLAISAVWKGMLGWGRWRVEDDIIEQGTHSGSSTNGAVSGTSTPVFGSGRSGVWGKPMNLRGNKSSLNPGGGASTTVVPALSSLDPASGNNIINVKRTSYPPQLFRARTPSPPSLHRPTAVAAPNHRQQHFLLVTSEVKILESIVKTFLSGVVSWEFPDYEDEKCSDECGVCVVVREGKGKDREQQKCGLAGQAMGEAMECLRGFSVVVTSLAMNNLFPAVTSLSSPSPSRICHTLIHSLSVLPAPILFDLLISSQPSTTLSPIPYPNHVWGITDEKWVREYLRGFSNAEEWRENYSEEVRKGVESWDGEKDWKDGLVTLLKVKEELDEEDGANEESERRQ